MKKLFGTDGIRAKAGQFPLDDDTVRIVGAALTEVLSDQDERGARIVTGRDTRESGPEIEKALHQGIIAAGGSAVSSGVITTPGVAFLTAHGDFDAGAVISASHNPFEDNGIKIFLPDGRKLDPDSEAYIERKVAAGDSVEETEYELDDSGASALQSRYLQHFGKDFGLLDLTGIKVIADCANGAASYLAPLLFRRFGGEVTTMNSDPDGRNINQDCGSLHIEHLRLAVLEKGADIGIAFDGDADRALFVDEEGEIVDGDAVLWIMANSLLEKDELHGSNVVATVMSNVGLELALESIGVELIRTDVGDKYVLDALLATGASVGGEQSGHIIFPSRTLVGDGMQTALFILGAMCEKGKKLSELRSGFTSLPQILVNVRVNEKRPFEDLPRVQDAVGEIERALDGSGRLLLRYSGTENLARVMIEGRDQTEIEAMAHRLANVIGDELGTDTVPA